MRVVPVRYTTDPQRMQVFLQALGLTTTIASDSGGWIQLAGAGGGVGLHEAGADRGTPGSDELSFESDEPLEAVGGRLEAAGFAAHIVDESFGRSLRVVDPDGVSLQINEAMTDTYGYSTS